MGTCNTKLSVVDAQVTDGNMQHKVSVVVAVLMYNNSQAQSDSVKFNGNNITPQLKQ